MFDNLLPVYLKELRSYFQSRMFWFVFAVYILILMTAVFVRTGFLLETDSELTSVFEMQINVFVLIVPALTIKLWADEKRFGTMELTLSLPVSGTALVLGKFLAVWSLCGLLIISTFGLCLTTAALTYVDLAEILLNYLVLISACGSLCAVSMAASSFTTQPVSAFVLSLAFCLLVSLLNLTIFIPEDSLSLEIWLRAGNSLHFVQQYSQLLSGRFSMSAVYYFVSMIVFPLWLNVMSVEWRKN